LATETLGAVRTVTALNAQPAVINQYRRFLFDAMRVGIHKGFKVGLGNGLLFGACFMTYALGFWYGGTLVADSVSRMCQPTLRCQQKPSQTRPQVPFCKRCLTLPFPTVHPHGPATTRASPAGRSWRSSSPS
jgi:hypothetical protein